MSTPPPPIPPPSAPTPRRLLSTSEAAQIPWQRALNRAARTPEDLVERGLLSPEQAHKLAPVAQRFEMLVSDYYLSLIDPDDPNDPVRRQALPDLAELAARPDERSDPIGDHAHQATPILVHRYPDRALLFPTFRCPMFCRYCFRKVTLNEEAVHLRQQLPPAVDYLRAHPQIKEVILSGGDPLMLPDHRLLMVIDAVRALPHIERIRLHTRFPVTLPQRLTPELAEGLGARRPLYVVTHFNHPRELSEVAAAGIERLVRQGITVLNQSVLLVGVNDDTQVLAELFSTLLRWQVRPYYLHHPDLTVGTQHFRLSLERGLALVRGLRGHITGLAWPTYVLDIPGGGGKVPVDSHFVQPDLEVPGRWWLESPLTGARQIYDDPAAQVGE